MDQVGSHVPAQRRTYSNEQNIIDLQKIYVVCKYSYVFAYVLH